MQVTTSTDHAFKLFGKSISLPPDVQSPSIISGENSLEEEEEEGIVEKDCSAENATKTTKEVDAPTANSEGPADTAGATGSDVHPLTPSINEEPANLEGLKSEKEQNDVTSSQEKTALKKPDKILPCPRCNSMDTKFCYYNNYNTNQPRHFCRACQRYWTAGGTMRNVPVGAGRRKNKNSASHYRHITISDALQAAHIDLSNGTQHPMLKRNGRVLSFGVSDSMVSVINLADKKATNPAQNGFHTLDEQRFTVPCKGEKGDDCSSVSSVTVSNSTERGGRACSKETGKPSVNGFESQIPCLPNVPWPYPWNSTLPPVAPQAFCPPGLPLSFYPSAYWNCSVMGTWNTSLPSPQSSSSVSQKTACCKPTSPAVGKHSRESNPTKPDDSEKEEPPKKKNGCVLVPKTLRIDDPSEAAKSSIWTTLGINNDATNGISLLKAFQPKTSEKNHLFETSMVLQTNPAALSRSINFLENS